MAKVKLLDKSIYELIAAGEVIERPSSIIKELVENSIDSGASAITVEIKRGGISYMRVTDNGCGIHPEDISTAFLRHATSKISDKNDLDNIHTLGFRGEALASVSAVSKVEVLSKCKDCGYGVHYAIEGSEEKSNEECGCPDGTTIIIRDIFYNVPARLKFLKKDVSEGNDIARIMEKIALSHPDISIKFIRENKQVMFTPGDNKLYSSIYSVMGRQFAVSLIPVNYNYNGIDVKGYTVKPLFGMKNRKMQNFFVNGRYVQSFICLKAIEEAYVNSIMEGKFPACVLCIGISPSFVDVNVHPQKTEVRFSDDKAVYEAIYFAVKNALLADSAPTEIGIDTSKKNYTVSPYGDKNEYVQTGIEIQPKKNTVPVDEYRKTINAVQIDKRDEKQSVTPEEYRKMAGLPLTNISKEQENKISYQKTYEPAHIREELENKDEKQTTEKINVAESTATVAPAIFITDDFADKKFQYISNSSFEKKNIEEENKEVKEDKKTIPSYKLIGEAFYTYIIAEVEDDIIFVDKHAAHERINFEKMKSGEVQIGCQILISPIELRLSYSQYDAVKENIDLVKELCFEIDIAEAPNIIVKGIPTMLDVCDATDITMELAVNLDEKRHNPTPEILDDMLHSIACKASIRANDRNSPEEMKALLDRVFSDEKIRYCPHGRPVMFKLKKREIEKQFRRII